MHRNGDNLSLPYLIKGVVKKKEKKSYMEREINQKEGKMVEKEMHINWRTS